jgi:hypothetical protein
VCEKRNLHLEPRKVIPPEADAEFVAHMEEVLDVYARPYDPSHPVICMDEQPVQLIKEVRNVMPATTTLPKRVDYEYERAGTASIFLFAEPLAGWREATARPQRCKSDWAREVAARLDGRYADCATVTWVCDHLNTHTPGTFYEVFPPEQARAYVSRIEFVHTPKHGSWLNIAENELSCLTSQCLQGQRIGDVQELHDEIGAWSADLVQDVFLVLVEKLPQFDYDPSKRFRGWLWTVIRNKLRE